MNLLVICALFCLDIVSCSSKSDEKSVNGREGGAVDNLQRVKNREGSKMYSLDSTLEMLNSRVQDIGSLDSNLTSARSGFQGSFQDVPEATHSNRSLADSLMEKAKEIWSLFNKQSIHNSTDEVGGDIPVKFTNFNGQSSGARTSAQDGVINNSDDNVCYPILGCFLMRKPWKSLLRPFPPPLHPITIDTKIYLYTRKNWNQPQVITLYPEISVSSLLGREGIYYHPEEKTVIVVHGFASSGRAEWMTRIKDAYLRKQNANVMLVDWGDGAQLLNYLQVASNTRIIGKELVSFVKYLIKYHRADVSNFHLIGHSLGAQICGYLGKEIRRIGRLTALDPAQPGFEGFSEEVRIDESDALFLDVIHTDARPFLPTLGFGMMMPVGHVDFYINGGFEQPGCSYQVNASHITGILDLAKFPVEVLAQLIACPHSRAYEYFIESLNLSNNCIFWGYRANLFTVLKGVTNTLTQGYLKSFTAITSSCSLKNCLPMGFDTDKFPARGTFIVTTNNKSPFCIPTNVSMRMLPLESVEAELSSFSSRRN